MARIFRWLLRIFIGLSLFTALAVAMVYYLATRSLPDYGRDHVVAGLQGPVEIIRDTYSVPHIVGENDADIYFGLGFAHAQDRLWQMTLLRRTAQGRLSELFGPETIEIDDLLRRFDFQRLAEESLKFQDAATVEALTAYAAGVNAWLKVVNDEALGRGAPEFFLFSKSIQAWQPADSLAILRLMSLRLSAHLSAEVLRARTSLLVDNDRLKDILPDAPGPGLTAVPQFAALFPGVPRFTANTTANDRFLDPVARRGLAGASNAWAAAPKRTALAGSLLASDPHLALSAPGIWMLARLEFQDGGIIGGTIPGMPAVLTGRSASLGWGVTASYLDDQDIYIERLNPENPAEYLTPDGYKPFKRRDITIRIKGAPDQNRVLRWSDNGPVIPPQHYNLGAVTPKNHVTTLAWTALDPQDRSMTAMLRLMRAKSVTQAIDAGALYTAPSVNLILADTQTVAYQLLGKVPDRDPAHQTLGRMPTAGWQPQNRWRGTRPYGANPRIIDPLGGLIANTNNKTVDRPFPDHISYLWGDTQRIERLKKLLQARKVHSRESFIEAQLDQVSFTARALLPLIARDLWFSGDAEGRDSRAKRRKTALDLLSNWNGEMNEHIAEPLIYAAWLRHLQRRLTADELGPLVREFTHADPVFIERVFRDVKGAAIWCDVVQSTKKENCGDMARSALDDALVELTQTYGSRLKNLRWGDAHQARQDHQALGRIPLLSWFVNIRQSTSGGDNTLMRGATRGTGEAPYANVHGAGYRGVYDFADPDSSVFVAATGQSGHPLSPHYDDLAQLWRRGDYIPMSLDLDLARAASLGIAHLTPKKQ